MRSRQRLLWVAAALLAGCTATRIARPTPWLEIERGRPPLELAQPLGMGEHAEAVRVRTAGRWWEVARAQLGVDVTLLDGDAALVSPPGQGWAGVVRADAARAVPLAGKICGLPRVSPDGRQIVCAACVDPGPGFAACTRVAVVTYD